MVDSIYRDNLFAGKVALITGGGSGIGARVAREMAKLGATVALAGRTLSKLEAVQQQIENEGGKAFSVLCNIRDEESAAKCVEESLKYAGKLDFLINNAGGQFPSPAQNISSKGWKAVVETNLNGTFWMSQQVFNQYFKKHGGAIVNVLVNLWNGFPLLSHTSAARAGVENLTKTLSIEWARYGVRVNSIAPGIIETSGLETYEASFREHVYAAKKNNLTYRLGTEAEVAGAMIFLLTPAAQYIVGETLKVDGGESIYHPLMPPCEHNLLPPLIL